MEKIINIEIMRGEHSLKMTDPKGTFTKEVPAAALFSEMAKAVRYYNNHPDGCIGVTFTVSE
jgi:hypothetical protein